MGLVSPHLTYLYQAGHSTGPSIHRLLSPQTYEPGNSWPKLRACSIEVHVGLHASLMVPKHFVLRMDPSP